MQGLIPFGSIYIAGGSTATGAQSTTPALLNLNALGAVNGAYTAGDPSVRPDKANSQMILGPGTYEFALRMTFTSDAAVLVNLQLYKNGIAGTALTGTKGAQTVAAAAGNAMVVTGTFTLTAADVLGATANFADPASTGFTGAGGAEKQGIPVVIGISSGSGTPNITPAELSWLVKRIG